MTSHIHVADSWQHVLEARGLRVEADAIGAVDQSRVDAWIREFAQPATLLTREELVFSQKVQATRQADSLASHLPDEAFEDAVTSLNASIANIDQQCKVLEAHKKAFSALRDRNVRHNADQTGKQSSQKTSKERAQLEFDIDSLVSNTKTQLQDHNQKVSSILDNAGSTIAKAFEKDDRILDGLQKIVPRLDATDDPRLSVESVNVLCDKWIVLERQAMRHRIDDTYEYVLRSTKATMNGNASTNGSAEDRAVRAELVELSSEIDGLVALVAEHHYRALINRSLSLARTDAENESARWSEYTACVLLYLTARLEALYDLYEHSHVHKAALSSLELELTDILTVKAPAEPQQGRNREPHTGRGLKPLRLVQATFSDMQETTLQVLKLLEVRGLEGADVITVRQRLAGLLRERTSASSAYLAESNQQHARMIGQSYTSQDQHLCTLLAAIQSTSTTGQVRLMDGDLQARLESFEAQTDSLAKEMQALDVDAIVRDITAQMSAIKD